MGLQVQQRLSDDHAAVAEVLEQVLTALENKDVERSYSKLDLLWARLAVHIRAEHLHLFPALARVGDAQPLIHRLRNDHDFFMRELAQSIAILRELPPQIVSTSDDAKFTALAATVREVENRLVTHNELEENEIYRGPSTILTDPEQTELLALINAELENRPPRFSADAWANRK